MHFIGLFIAVILMAVVNSETCTTNSNCVDTSCAGASTVICQHPDGAGVVDNGGLCTCTEGRCVQASDCYGDNASSLHCADAMRHCYDGKCVCDRFPAGKK